MSQDKVKKLGIYGLTAIVFGSMIGSGIYNIVQNMAVGASVGAVMVSWVITAVGMLFLVFTFKSLADRRPDINGGIYQYAQVGFGNYLGFNIGWGYWLCTAFSNVAFAVMLNDAVGVFIPSLIDHGWHSILFGSCVIWVMYIIVRCGIHSAAILNIAITSIKIMSLVLVIAVIFIYFRLSRLEYDFWGQLSDLGPLAGQVRNTMPVTLWCFIGIEGAAMMSARAKRSSDVGKASVCGFVLAWVLYVLVSVMAYGVVSRVEMASYGNPSVAYLLKSACGEWAYYFVILSVILSLFGGWIAWTLICAQVPYEAAHYRMFPRLFLHVNRHGVPTYGLLIASVVMQLFYLGVIMAEEVYMTAIEIAGMMVLPAYLFSGLFMLKAACCSNRYMPGVPANQLTKYKVIGAGCSVYCLWLIYAGGLDLLMATSLFYLPGIYFYIMARREWAPDAPVLCGREKLYLALLVFFAVLVAVLHFMHIWY